MSDRSATVQCDKALRTILFAAFAAWIVISPFFAQALGWQTSIIRPWIMFKEVGIGILKGEFIYTAKDGQERRLTPLELLGEDRYPVHRHAYRFDRLVFHDEQMAKFTASFCAANRDDYANLRFEGKVGSGDSWRRLSLDDLCGGPPG